MMINDMINKNMAAKFKEEEKKALKESGVESK